MAHAALSVVDGRTWNLEAPGSLPIGAMTPVQFRAGLELDWNRWTVAPRLLAVGQQRALATDIVNGRETRRTLDGYTLVAVNLRRARVLGAATAYATIENLFDARYRANNQRAYTNPEELTGAPQSPRRITVGLEMRVR
jgi:outer membrane receptor protein involved in Fe transport